jgi:thiol-disulfide isomerase/thioredoxin
VTLLDGSVWRASAAAGQVLVVYWWASWCPFCAVQSPHIEKLWRKERSRGLQVLALSIDRTQEAAAGYMRQKGYTFPAGMLTPDVAKVLPKPKGLPVVVVRGRAARWCLRRPGKCSPKTLKDWPSSYDEDAGDCRKALGGSRHRARAHARGGQV